MNRNEVDWSRSACDKMNVSSQCFFLCVLHFLPYANQLEADELLYLPCKTQVQGDERRCRGSCLLLVRLCPGSFNTKDFTSRKLCHRHAHFVDVKTEAHSSVTSPEVHKQDEVLYHLLSSDSTDTPCQRRNAVLNPAGPHSCQMTVERQFLCLGFLRETKVGIVCVDPSQVGDKDRGNAQKKFISVPGM